MDEARRVPEFGSDAMGDGGDPARSEARANPGLKDRAKETVRDARERAVTEVRERAGTARDSATRIAEERKRTLADSVHALASAFDAAASSLTEGQQARLAEWTRDLSGRTHRIATYLDEQDTRGLVNDLEGTAKEHPTAFLGTSFAAGLAAGRFLRASQRDTDTGVPATNADLAMMDRSVPATRADLAMPDRNVAASSRALPAETAPDIDFHADAALLPDETKSTTPYGSSTTPRNGEGGL